MSIETKLCDATGFTECVLFSMARVAISYLMIPLSDVPIFLPSNICPALANAVGPNAKFLPVSEHNGLARPTGGVVVQLYGCRQEYSAFMEIDPLLTCWKQNSKAESAVISFGYDKTIALGGGGALLTKNKELARKLRPASNWPAELTDELSKALDDMDANIARRKERWEIWEEHLSPRFWPAPAPTIPWRVICTIHQDDRDRMVEAVRANGCRAGTNYPPLPGCTDPSSVKWGREVINFWLEDDPKQALRDLI